MSLDFRCPSANDFTALQPPRSGAHALTARLSFTRYHEHLTSTISCSPVLAMAAPQESGDDYIRRIASFIRTHEANLAQGGLARRRRTKKPSEPAASVLNPLSWFAPTDGTQSPVRPMNYTTDTYRLFYLLVRMETLGLDVGSLDVRVDNPARPMSYVNVFPSEKADVLSLTSFRSSFSGISKLSLGGNWWSRPPPTTVDTDLKYLYSSFTKLPALVLSAPGPEGIADEAANSPNALPLDVFRTIEALECTDVDPRTILGWDRLAEGLRSLTIRRSGLEDISDVFITAVLEDQARRDGSFSRSRSRQVGSQVRTPSLSLPETVLEETEESLETPTAESPPRPGGLSTLKWAFLKHLNLSENALTFVPNAPLSCLTSVTHLNLSSNLLVSVPPGLSALYSLISLDLSDNMIDSVLGIYTQLGQILHLDVSRNRLESLCGLERLLALERIDLSHNQVEESAEVGRLAMLPHIESVAVEGNPVTEIEEGWRIRCFTHFWNEGKEILLDGSPAGLYERQYRAAPVPAQMTSARPFSVAAAPSPPVVAVGSVASNAARPLSPSPTASVPSSSAASPHLSAVGKGRKKKTKRVVQLDGEEAKVDDVRSRSQSRHRRMFSADERLLSPPQRSPRFGNAIDITASPPQSPPIGPSSPPLPTSTRPPATKSRHSRYQSEFVSSSPSPSATPAPAPAPSPFVASSSQLSGSTTLGRQTMSPTGKAKTRRGRVSASVYEPEVIAADDATAGPETEARRQLRQADAYRARIEALRSEVGDGWLKVFSQSGLGSPSPGAQTSAKPSPPLRG
jgi:Leucine-rich repeat (LRR) protein